MISFHSFLFLFILTTYPSIFNSPRRVLKLTPLEMNELYKLLPEKAFMILSEGTGIPIADLQEGTVENRGISG